MAQFIFLTTKSAKCTILRLVEEGAMHRLVRSKCHSHSKQRFTAGNENYEFLGSIGNGAVGLVRKARNTKTGLIVAVKVLAPDPKYINEDAFDEVETRFKREGTRGAHLQHSNLVKTIAFEDNEGGECFDKRQVKNPFLVMEYIGGRTLESLIKRIGSSSEPGRTHVTEQTLFVASRICDALAYLHKKQIIHRDVKPANIFLSAAVVGSVPSLVKLGDFGITKWGDFLASAASGTLTVTKQEGLGTMKYMSPEQAVRPKEVSVRSDMFSVGVTFFELFTGQILPSQHHVFEIMSARASRESTMAKLLSLGIKCQDGALDMFEVVFDMFLTSPRARPASVDVAGRMQYLLEKHFDH